MQGAGRTIQELPVTQLLSRVLHVSDLHWHKPSGRCLQWQMSAIHCSQYLPRPAEDPTVLLPNRDAEGHIAISEKNGDCVSSGVGKNSRWGKEKERRSKHSSKSPFLKFLSHAIWDVCVKENLQ